MTKQDFGHGNPLSHSPSVHNLNRGPHTIQIAGRSNGYSIDRVREGNIMLSVKCSTCCLLPLFFAVVVGFAEYRIMDIITGRAPPPARAESHLSKGSRELARPGPSLFEPLYK